MRPARILSPFLAPCKRLEITADPNNYFPEVFRLMFRRSGNFRLAINFDELSTVRRFVLVNFSRCDEFQFPSPFALLHVLSFLLLSHEEKNPLIVGIDKRKRFFLSFLVAPIDRPPFNSQPLHFGENRSEREFIGNLVPSPSPMERNGGRMDRNRLW